MIDLFCLELKYCETNNITCQNGATCVSLPEEDGNYRCLCADGYIGRNCEVDKKKVILSIYIKNNSTRNKMKAYFLYENK